MTSTITQPWTFRSDFHTDMYSLSNEPRKNITAGILLTANAIGTDTLAYVGNVLLTGGA